MPLDVHPEMQSFVEDEKAWPAGLTLAEERRVWSEFCRARNRPRPAGMKVEDRTLRHGGLGVPVRLYRPAAAPASSPAIVYIHGGGWILGDLDTNDAIAWGLAEGAGAVAVSVDYRLAPEHPFPAAFDDCYAVLCALAKEGASLGIDGSRLAACGDSAGGNLSAALSLAARDRRGPAIRAQGLIYPCVGTDLTLPSFVEMADAPMLTTAGMRHYYEAYAGTNWAEAPPYCMPAHAGDLRALPPALVHVAEYDPLRDDGRVYAERLRAAGVSVEYRVAKRMLHSFMRARFNGPAAKAEFDAICAFLRRHLFA